VVLEKDDKDQLDRLCEKWKKYYKESSRKGTYLMLYKRWKAH